MNATHPRPTPPPVDQDPDSGPRKLHPNEARKVRNAEKDFGRALRRAALRAKTLATLYESAGADDRAVQDLRDLEADLQTAADRFHRRPVG